MEEENDIRIKIPNITEETEEILLSELNEKVSAAIRIFEKYTGKFVLGFFIKRELTSEGIGVEVVEGIAIVSPHIEYLLDSGFTREDIVNGLPNLDKVNMIRKKIGEIMEEDDYEEGCKKDDCEECAHKELCYSIRERVMREESKL